MSKPTGWIVRPADMKALQHELNRVRSNTGDLWAAARTLVGFAEPQQTQPPPVHVASLALPPAEQTMRAYADADAAQVEALRSALAQWVLPLDLPVNVPTVDALERVHALAIQALGRGTDVSPGALLDITDVEPQPYDMPSPEADALDRIADLWGYAEPYANKLRSIAAILRETGRAL